MGYVIKLSFWLTVLNAGLELSSWLPMRFLLKANVKKMMIVLSFLAIIFENSKGYGCQK